VLLELQRTNLISYSEDFSNAYWEKTTTTVISSNAISPDGALNAAKLIESSSNGTQRIIRNAPTSVSSDVSMGVFAKANERDWIMIRESALTGAYAFFNIKEGYIGEIGITAIPKIEDYGNGWFRCSITKTTTSASLDIRICLSDGVEAYQGDGTSGVYIYGAQLESGSYPTSYIPTQGSAVTRVKDLCDTQNLSHVIGQTEGVIFYDAILVHKSKDTSEDLFELSIDDGSGLNIFFINNYNNSFVVSMASGGADILRNNSFNPTEGARYKLGFAYKQNDFALYINGNQIATISSGTAPLMNQITFGNYYNNQLNLSNSVKVNDFRLYNTRLSNAELAILTTI
jgi:hypothetical protein